MRATTVMMVPMAKAALPKGLSSLQPREDEGEGTEVGGMKLPAVMAAFRTLET